jgi:hypothetical protein|nr:MAG TPA: hypothetical protein [Caudoviricetes sp.]
MCPAKASLATACLYPALFFLLRRAIEIGSNRSVSPWWGRDSALPRERAPSPSQRGTLGGLSLPLRDPFQFCQFFLIVWAITFCGGRTVNRRVPLRVTPALVVTLVGSTTMSLRIFQQFIHCNHLLVKTGCGRFVRVRQFLFQHFFHLSENIFQRFPLTFDSHETIEKIAVYPK